MLYLFIFISVEISYHIRILFVCFFSKYSMYVYLFVLMKNLEIDEITGFNIKNDTFKTIIFIHL